MSDIELVIKIPEEIRLALINNIQLSPEQKSISDSYIIHAIVNGTPLPKGHGRIVDIGQYEGKIIASRKYYGVNKIVEVAELDTIIEAESEDT